MTALRFFRRRPRPAEVDPLVHTGDPNRLPHWAMCGVEIDGNYVAVTDPQVSHARACIRCAGWRELAEERAARARGIIGGWELHQCVVGADSWCATDSLGQVWIVTVSPTYGKRGGPRTPTYRASVMTAKGTREVRKLGAKSRAKWPSETRAMMSCEDLARSGEYLLDRPKRQQERGES